MEILPFTILFLLERATELFDEGRWIMARQGCCLSESEIRRIVYLLSETDLVAGAIAERMGCSKTAIMSINRRFQIRDYGTRRNTWSVRLVADRERECLNLTEPQAT